jgi:DNA-binding transcriptional LysR family regulator
MSNIRFLRTFIAVARHGSFAAAADKVALTQAAVSLQMRALEAEVRHALFDRGGRTAHLNDAGKAMLVHAERVVAVYDDMLVATREANEIVGSVTVGAVVSSMGAMAGIVASLKASHPRLAIRLIAAKSMELCALLERGDVAAAVIAQPSGRTPASLRWWPLYAEPHVMLASSRGSARATAATMARARPFLRFDRTQHTGVQIERALRKNRLQVNDFLELNSLEAIVELVRQDVGVAVVPLLRGASWESDPALRVLRLLPATPPRIVGLMERKDRERSGVKAVVRESVIDQLGDSRG